MKEIKPQTPAEAIKHFFENTSFTDMLWILIACVVGYILFIIARKQYRRNSYTIIDLATWGIITAFTAIITTSVLAYTISKDGLGSWGWYSICLLVSFLVVYAANKELHKYQRLITTLIVIVIGSCLFWSFIKGEQSIMYAIMTGVLQGGSFQLFLTTLVRYIKGLQGDTKKSEDKEKWDNEHRKI